MTTVRKMGYKCLYVRVDEDKSLARSSEFAALLIKLNCVMQTTGGHNSENNGKVERPHRTLGDMVRSSLATANILFGDKLPDSLRIENFWCFALQMASFTLRRMYNKNRKQTPYEIVHGMKPRLIDLATFGSHVTVIAPNKSQIPKLSERGEDCFFLGYGNTVKNILY